MVFVHSRKATKRSVEDFIEETQFQGYETDFAPDEKLLSKWEHRLKRLKDRSVHQCTLSLHFSHCV
jgi:hypothetical protein